MALETRRKYGNCWSYLICSPLTSCIDTLITALPERWDPTGGKTMLEQILSIIDDSTIRNLEALTKAIVLATISSLQEPYKATLDESCFNIFEKSIAYLVRSLYSLADIYKC
jgi:hypothetical protein